ncbi:hypothetical protein ACFVVM_03230 [Nocardia sp. NPDC058176]|uniref:hypothetical protein n=1 Tax=Nocardia sp. NPDC058176 TaxID=3346368 RepID=UPI0036DEFC38
MRAVVWVLFGVVIAIVSFANSYDKLTETRVSCGYQQMSRGDRCQEIGGSSLRERSYAEQRSANQNEGLISLVVGFVALVASLIYSIIAVGQRVEARRGT